MEVMRIDNTAFGAVKLRPNAVIEAFSAKQNKYLPRKAVCVEFNPHADTDFKALKNTGESWLGGYAENIASAAEKIRQGKISGKRHKIFGLTTQQNDFAHIDYSKLLLLCEFEHVSKDILHIWHIQTNPKFVYSVKSDFKHIGTGFMDILKKMSGKIFTVKSAYNAAEFYEKNGFKIIDTKDLLFMYLPKSYKTGKIKLNG